MRAQEGSAGIGIPFPGWTCGNDYVGVSGVVFGISIRLLLNMVRVDALGLSGGGSIFILWVAEMCPKMNTMY